MANLRDLAFVAAATGLILAVGCGGGGVGDPVSDHSEYTIDSSFDVQGNFDESGLGDVLNMLRDMSDDKDDPGKFVVQQVVEQLPTPLQWAAKPLESTLGHEVNEAIYALVPTAADEAKAIADALSDAARQFTMKSRLEVGIDAEDRYTGKHEIEYVAFAYGGDRVELDKAKLGDRVSPAVRIPIHIDGPELTIDEHKLKWPVGTLLKEALDEVIIKGVIKEYLDVVGLIARWFACVEIGAQMAESLGGGAAQIIAACVVGAEKVAGNLTDRLIKLDKHGRLRLRGSARAESDGVTFEGEGWSGAYRIGEDIEAPLDPEHDTFTAEKISDTPAN